MKKESKAEFCLHCPNCGTLLGVEVKEIVAKESLAIKKVIIKGILLQLKEGRQDGVPRALIEDFASEFCSEKEVLEILESLKRAGEIWEDKPKSYKVI